MCEWFNEQTSNKLISIYITLLLKFFEKRRNCPFMRSMRMCSTTLITIGHEL